MKLKATIVYQGRSSFTAKSMGQAFASANELTVEYWHAHFLSLHFLPSAAARYGYAKRSGEDEPAWIPAKRGRGGMKVTSKTGAVTRIIRNPKYFWRKKRKGFGTVALVRTGASQRATQTIKITASSKQGVGTFPLLPKYFYQYRKDLAGGRTPIDKAAELVILLDSELAILGAVHEQATAAYLEKLNATDRETIVYAA